MSGAALPGFFFVRECKYNRAMPIGSRLRASDLGAFRGALLAWYRKNRRDVPWRATRDPYRIWLSEIMLQQTRVAAVVEYYKRFLKRFPTVEKLAAAREASVLAQWSGLGYYRRARNLHAAAKVVVREHGGEFLGKADDLRGLPGIGRYTAAAIASIAFGEPVAVVDGNVERVISRVSGAAVSGERLWERASEMLSREHPGDFNQAMMELGATVCLPTQPMCIECPVYKFCRTQGKHARVSTKPRQSKREIVCSLNEKSGEVLLVRRSDEEGLMPGMWELPVASPTKGGVLFSLRHSITVTNYTVRVVRDSESATGTWVAKTRLRKLPLTGLTKKILRRAEII